METQQKTTYAAISNPGTIPLREVPVLSYVDFAAAVDSLLRHDDHHCVTYHAYPAGSGMRFICCIADDSSKTIKVLSHEWHGGNKSLASLTRKHFPMHIYERELSENFGFEFTDHPWPKPVRYAFNRADRQQVINNYPFFQIGGNELHQVGVGPIHAGVIEPGHFRFLCSGENVLHLEIQLGWQHRGVEDLFLKKPSLIQRTVLSESIAADTALGHSLAFVNLFESLGRIEVNPRLEIERTIGLELERIAMHVGDLGNINIGLAYQLASSVFGTLRTPVINYAQTWCGNRFGKGLNRVGGTHYPFTPELAEKLTALLTTFEKSFDPMCERMFALPSVLARTERIGKVSEQQMKLIGAVGMAARMTGIRRDIRNSHPFAAYKSHPIRTDTLEPGDVWARMMLRRMEIKTSIEYIRSLMSQLREMNGSAPPPTPADRILLQPESLVVSLVEGWRGEICHAAVTNERGEIAHYKAKDPSVHNWFALALSLRDLEISDFPINNKSYNLSYCGHDL